MNSSLPPSMWVAVTPAAGAPPALVVRPVPEPGPGEVLVRVMASSVNPTDVMTWKRGAFVTGQTAPFVGGYDVAGVVAGVGRGVTVLDVGDAVAGMPHFPAPAEAFAEFTVVPARQVAHLPREATPVSLSGWGPWAGLPLAGLTARQALVDTACVQPGQRVLIHAASGGVGHLAVQLAVALGAEVTAVTSARVRSLVDTLGAHHLIDRAEADWQDRAHSFDVVLDTVGGPVTQLSLDLTTPDGVVVALHPYANDEIAHREPRLRRMLVEPDQPGLRQLVDLVDRGQLTVYVGATYPLSDVGEALLHVENNKTPAKTIIRVQGEHA